MLDCLHKQTFWKSWKAGRTYRCWKGGEPRPIPEKRHFSADDIACFDCCHRYKGKTSVLDKYDNFDHVLIWQKPQQLAGKTTVPDRVICRCQIDKYGTGLFLSVRRIFYVLCQQNDLIHSWLPPSKSSLLFREQWIHNWLDTGVDKPLENPVGGIEQRHRSITLWVPYELYRLWDYNYKRSSLNFWLQAFLN